MASTFDWKLQRVLIWTSLSIASFIAVLQIMFYYKATRNAKAGVRSYHSFTFGLLMGIDITNVLLLVIRVFNIYAWPSCEVCGPTWLLILIGYTATRCLSAAFFVDRASHSQGIAPVLPRIIFDHHLFHWLLLILFISYSIFFVWKHVDSHHSACVHTVNDWHCEFSVDTEGMFAFSVMVMASLIDVGLSTFCLFLFIKPLMYVLKKDEAQSPRQQRSMMEIKRTMIWNVILTAIYSVHSTIIIIGFSFFGGMFHHFLPIDGSVNTVAIFLMLGKNRGYITRGFGCSKHNGLPSPLSMTSVTSTSSGSNEKGDMSTNTSSK